MILKSPVRLAVHEERFGWRKSEYGGIKIQGFLSLIIEPQEWGNFYISFHSFLYPSNLIVLQIAETARVIA